MSAYEPSKTKIEYWCEECGLKQWKDDRINHRVGGRVCSGRVVKATYALVKTEPLINLGIFDGHA
jgi:hypothetical protein